MECVTRLWALRAWLAMAGVTSALLPVDRNVVVHSLGAAGLRSILDPDAARAGVGDILDAAVRNNEITYSQNGKNFQRMSRGDYSMGSALDATLRVSTLSQASKCPRQTGV